MEKRDLINHNNLYEMKTTLCEGSSEIFNLDKIILNMFEQLNPKLEKKTSLDGIV